MARKYFLSRFRFALSRSPIPASLIALTNRSWSTPYLGSTRPFGLRAVGQDQLCSHGFHRPFKPGLQQPARGRGPCTPEILRQNPDAVYARQPHGSAVIGGMKFARKVFLAAGIYGLVILLPQYLLEQKVGRDFPPAITHPEFYYGFLGVTVAWQVAFLVIAFDPVRYRIMMLPGALEKAGFGFAVLALYLQQRVPAALLPFALLDLVLGALFLMAFQKTRCSTDQPG